MTARYAYSSCRSHQQGCYRARPWSPRPTCRVAQIKIPHRTKCNFSTTVFAVSITSFHTSLKSSGSSMWLSWSNQLVPYQLQNFFELTDVLRFGLKWLVAFKHSSPDMVGQASSEAIHLYQWIHCSWYSNPVLRQLCHVCRRAVLLKDEARWQNRSAFLNLFRQ